MKDLWRVFQSLRPRKKISNPTCLFFPLINIRNKKMKTKTHPASPTLEQNQEPLPFHLTYLAPSPPCHLTTLPPFPPRHLTTLPPFSLSHLKSLPPTNKAFQNNKIKPTVSPHIFLQKVHNITILKQGHIPPPGKRSQIVVSEAWFAGH